MIHLAIVTHVVTPGDGQGRVNYEIAQAALDRGDRVTLVATSVEPELARHERVRWIRIPVDGWPTALVRNLVFASRSARWLRRHRTELDVVLANGCITWAPAHVNAAHFVHSAWIKSTVHTARLQSGPAAWYQWLYTRLNAAWEKRAFAQARSVVAVSDRVADELRDAGVDPARIETIPNGVDLDEFRPGPAHRADLGLPEGVPLALFIGDLQTPRKNLDTVLNALQGLPDVHLAVAGRVAGSPYPDLAAQLGLANRVHFLDFRRDVAQLLQAADACVCPSRYEPFSLVVLEALASGCPVVTASTVGAAPLVTNACGRVVDDPEDADALRSALHAILTHPHRERLRRAARSAAEGYGWSQTAAAYLAVVDQCVPLSAASRSAGAAPVSLSSPPSSTTLSSV